MIFYKFNLSFT